MGAKFGRVFCVLVIVLAVRRPAFGQTAGEITGLVTDSTGGAVVGAAVTVTNPQTNFTRRENTNAAGLYNFPSLLPGVYNVKVEMSGFQSEMLSCKSSRWPASISSSRSAQSHRPWR